MSAPFTFQHTLGRTQTQTVDVDPDRAYLLLGELVNFLERHDWPEVSIVNDAEEDDGEEFHTVCPRCGAKDSIVDSDIAIAADHHLAVEHTTANSVTFYDDAEGDDVASVFLCADYQGGCGLPVELPKTIERKF